ncbi:MAG: hypothetical protein ABIN55_08765, partial [Aeromicrobium sp.]
MRLPYRADFEGRETIGRINTERNHPCGIEADGNIQAQVTLPASIDSARVAPAIAPRAAPKSVLLTGATGFLGAYVLRDLI